MTGARQLFGKTKWLVLFSLAYGLIMLSLDEGGCFQFYSSSPYHRYQADALLHGHCYLASSIDALQPGLAWHDGRVQQVWGLGIGCWLAPFQALWQLFGGTVFPDRIALGIAFALLALYAGNTGLRLARMGRRAAGLGLIWLVLLFPALCTLSRVSHLVFEETVLYAVLVSLGTLIALVRVVLFGSRADYVVCCLLGAFAVWVRPTHGVYGLPAVIVSSFIAWKRRRSVKTIVAGICAVLGSLFLLAWSNYMRFGSPAEFGHRLTVSSESMMYLTRFGNPYRETPTVAAAAEMFGALFLDSKPRDAWAFSEGLFPGQARTVRWRRLYLTAFDSSYAVLCVGALVGTPLWLLRKRILETGSLLEDHWRLLAAALWLWSSISLAGLSVFYLYYPALASRYLLDFAPALVGFATLAWAFLSGRSPRVSLVILAAWLVFGIAMAKTPAADPHAFARPATLELPQAHGTDISDFNGIYTMSRHPRETGIFGNGYGWDAESGIADDVICLALDNPQFVELNLSERRGMNGEKPRSDTYRAQIDGQPLSLRKVTKEDEGIRVEFDVPEPIRARHQDELLFLCFSGGYDAEDRDSERFLYTVRWR